MNLLAFRNLCRDKVRLTLTLVGIVFAVVLITVQIGLFLGFAETTSGIIDHSQADLWIAAQGVKNFDAASPLIRRGVRGGAFYCVDNKTGNGSVFSCDLSRNREDKRSRLPKVSG